MDICKVIRKEELTTDRWSGGTTTQLAIWPESALYSERNFIWRVSTAQVHAEESQFTSLPGISRCLMILDGELFLHHEGHYDTFLSRFSQDNFDGGWKSLSRGRVTDFNLMTTSGEGRVQAVEILPFSEQTIYLMPSVHFWKRVSEVFYLPDGKIDVELPKGLRTELNAGDVITRFYEGEADASEFKLCNQNRETLYVIRAVIYHN